MENRFPYSKAIDMNFNVPGSYDWYAHMMGLGTSGTAEVTVDDIGIRLE